MEKVEGESRWHEALAEHVSEAGWSDKVPTSIGSSNLATVDMSEDWTLSVRPGQLIP